MRAITITPDGAWIDDGRWPQRWNAPLVDLIKLAHDAEIPIRVTDRMYDNDPFSPKQREAIAETALLQARYNPEGAAR